jgi:DNA-binding transcriptional LysR family regulator
MYAAAIDTALANHGLVRKVALWQPSFFALPHVVERTDLIGTVPKRVGVHAAEHLAIEIYEVPLPLPQPEFALYWHERSRDDLGHRWLRDRIAALMRVQSD